MALINYRKFVINQRLKELNNFLEKFPDSEFCPQRRKERDELLEELREFEVGYR